MVPNGKTTKRKAEVHNRSKQIFGKIDMGPPLLKIFLFHGTAVTQAREFLFCWSRYTFVFCHLQPRGS